MLKQYITEALKGFTTPKKSCSCGCGGCSDSQPKLALLESKTPISEGLRYHIENGISLQENVFRIGSKKYLQLFAEARMLLEWGNISLDENSKFLIENTDIGKFGIYEGKKVPLDLPAIDEAEYQGKDVPIGKPKRGGSKAYYVYVKDGDKVKKVSFGSGGLRAKIKDPKARAAFAARHNCDQKKDRTTAGYWSCNLPRYAPALGLGPKMNTYW
jgi:hypothetical protein